MSAIYKNYAQSMALLAASAAGAAAVVVGTISDKPFTARHGLVAPMRRSALLGNRLQYTALPLHPLAGECSLQIASDANRRVHLMALICAYRFKFKFKYIAYIFGSSGTAMQSPKLQQPSTAVGMTSLRRRLSLSHSLSSSVSIYHRESSSNKSWKKRGRFVTSLNLFSITRKCICRGQLA